MTLRISGLTWALVCCPIIGWAAAMSAESSIGSSDTPVWAHLALMSILPAALASAGNALLGRDMGAVARAGIFAAVVCLGGLFLLAALFFLTTPPEFFQ